MSDQQRHAESSKTNETKPQQQLSSAPQHEWPYSHYYPNRVGVSMRGGRRPTGGGVSARGGSITAVAPPMRTASVTASSTRGVAKRRTPPPSVVYDSHSASRATTHVQTSATTSSTEITTAPFAASTEPNNDVAMINTLKDDIQQKVADDDDDDDDEYKEGEDTEDEDEEDEDEEEEPTKEVEDFSFFQGGDDEELLEELQDLLEDYDHACDDWLLFSNNKHNLTSEVDNVITAASEKTNSSQPLENNGNQEAANTTASCVQAAETVNADKKEGLPKITNNMDLSNCSSFSSSSSSSCLGPPKNQKVHNNNYNSVLSNPPSPTMHNNSSFPLHFIRKHPKGSIINPGRNTISNSDPAPETTTATSKDFLEEPTQTQLDQLTELLDQFYQVLIQQAILAVRNLQFQKQQNQQQDQQQRKRQLLLLSTDTKLKQDHQEQQQFTSEGSEILVADELAEILDGAVGMLQELDALRKNAIRNIVTFEEEERQQQTKKDHTQPNVTNIDLSSSNVIDSSNNISSNNTNSRRVLTRSAFTRTLQERYSNRVSGMHPSVTSSNTTNNFSSGEVTAMVQGVTNHRREFRTVFDVRGLSRLDDAFRVMDESVACKNNASSASSLAENILDPKEHGRACELLLLYSDADIHFNLIPGKIDKSQLFTDPEAVSSDMKKIQNRFTASEDNLVLRGVNVFGEKEWSAISQRFLPDRPLNAISRRYAKLCVLMYKACGIYVSDNGDLAFGSGGEATNITEVSAPAKFNVNRWSFEEDVALLKAVPIVGHNWADINKRWIKHRNRGHLRKRYQVLERRIKAAVKREHCPKGGKRGKQTEIIRKQAPRPSDAIIASSSTVSARKRSSSIDAVKTGVLATRPPYAVSSNAFHRPSYGAVPYYYPYYQQPYYPPDSYNFYRSPSEKHPTAGSPLKSRDAVGSKGRNVSSHIPRVFPHPKQSSNTCGGEQDTGRLTRSRNHSVEEHSLLCYENAEEFAKLSDTKTDPQEPINDSVPFVDIETPSQLIDFSTRMLDFNADDSSRIGIEKILEENETKVHSTSFAHFSEYKHVELTQTSTNFDEVKKALILGSEDISHLPQFTLDASGLSLLSQSDTRKEGKAKSDEANLCNTKSIYANVLERVKGKSGLSVCEKNGRFALEVSELGQFVNNLTDQSTTVPSMATGDLGTMGGKSSRYSNDLAARTEIDPQMSMTAIDIGDMEFSVLAFGERTREALETSCAADRTYKAFPYPESSLEIDPVLSFDEGFDPISALKALSHPASPAASPGLKKNTNLKRPRQSLFASAISSVQEKDGKRTKS